MQGLVFWSVFKIFFPFIICQIYLDWKFLETVNPNLRQISVFCGNLVSCVSMLWDELTPGRSRDICLFHHFWVLVGALFLRKKQPKHEGGDCSLFNIKFKHTSTSSYIFMVWRLSTVFKHKDNFYHLILH